MLNEPVFARALAACMTLYRQPLSADVLDLYCRALSRFETDDCLRALEVHLLDPDVGQYPPKPADIVRRISGSNVTAAALAWAKVSHAVRKIGAWQSVIFDDPAIHAAIDQMGGWVKVCGMTEQEQPFRQKDFERLYKGFKDTASLPAYPGKLIGRAEAYNAREGHESPPPIMIGDLNGAMLTANGGSDKPRLAGEIVGKLRYIREAGPQAATEV